MANQTRNRMYEKNDYRHLAQLRAVDFQDQEHEEGKEPKMIVEGKAITYDEPTVLFTYDGEEYKEVIEKGAFAYADLKDAFFKYNHTDSIMAMARYKNQTLKFEERDDGVWITAELANTSAGRDLYELIKRGDIDKMSFAFNIEEEDYDEANRTWYVRKISKIWDVAAVPVPAYDNTLIYARRLGEAEANRVKEVEASVKLNKEKRELAQNKVAALTKFYKK